MLQVEKHIRKNNLTVTFTDQLGQAKHSEHVTGEKEARKLAFYLFWNIKPYFTRSVQVAGLLGQLVSWLTELPLSRFQDSRLNMQRPGVHAGDNSSHIASV